MMEGVVSHESYSMELSWVYICLYALRMFSFYIAVLKFESFGIYLTCIKFRAVLEVAQR